VKRALAVLACALLGGCVYSLEPFYAKESLVASPVAAGRWQRLDKGGHAERGETWEFTADRVVVHDERGQWRELDARYFRVGGMTFVDTFPRDLGSESPSEAYWALHRAPFHLLSRIEVSADRVVARPLASSARFRELSRQAPFASRIAERGDYLTFVTGATPADWQTFLEKHANDPALFSEKGQLVFAKLKE
jgi:hypothetical protein